MPKVRALNRWVTQSITGSVTRQNGTTMAPQSMWNADKVITVANEDEISLLESLYGYDLVDAPGTVDQLLQRVRAYPATVMYPYGVANSAGVRTGYWRLNEAAGAGVAVCEGTSGNLTINGTVTLGASGILAGDPGTAFDFQNTNAYLSYGSSTATFAFTGNTSFSGHAWIRPSALTTACIMGKGATTPTEGWMFYVTPGGLLSYRRSTGGTSQTGSVDAGDALTANTTYHVGFAYNASTSQVKLYIDGVLKKTIQYTTAASIGDSGTNFSVGRLTDGVATAFAGKISEPACGGGALSDDYFRACYIAGKYGPT